LNNPSSQHAHASKSPAPKVTPASIQPAADVAGAAGAAPSIASQQLKAADSLPRQGTAAGSQATPPSPRPSTNTTLNIKV
jgi:hypothetical protein